MRFALLLLLAAAPVAAQPLPTAAPAVDVRLYDIARAASADRLEADIRALAGFGTRSTLSDTTSDTRGIGAARRWIREQFEQISADCGGCLDVFEQRTLVPGDPDSRIPTDTYIVNVVAVQRGTTHPDRYVMMAGDVDSRASDVLDGEIDAPGANDNATGMAGAIEAARILTQHRFGKSIVYAGLSGEEQGLFGGRHLAELADSLGWHVEAVLNNDMIGNTCGINGTCNNRSFRIFSEPVDATQDARAAQLRRFFGGEVDGPSRQIARYVHAMTREYLPLMEPQMIYRLDRFGRGGHHRPFNDLGFAGVRLMETNEHYDRQHQDIRTEDGRFYGDTIDYVDFEYAARMTGVNALVLAGMAWAPAPPENVRIGGAVQPSTRLVWEAGEDPTLAGFWVVWRDTTSPVWQHRRWVGEATDVTLENVVIDNYLFGVQAAGTSGALGPVAYPTGLLR